MRQFGIASGFYLNDESYEHKSKLRRGVPCQHPWNSSPVKPILVKALLIKLPGILLCMLANTVGCENDELAEDDKNFAPPWLRGFLNPLLNQTQKKVW